MKFLKSQEFYESSRFDGSIYIGDASTLIYQNSNKELVFKDPSAGENTLSSLINTFNGFPATFNTNSAWVNGTIGNDSTAEVGNPLKPFLSIQTAINSISSSPKNIYIVTNKTENFQTLIGQDVNIHLIGEILLDASIFLTSYNGSGIYGDGTSRLRGKIQLSSPGSAIFYLKNLDKISNIPGESIFIGRDLEINNVRIIESNALNILNSPLGNVNITNVGQILNTNDVSANTNVISGAGSFYLSNIGLIQIDNSSGKIFNSHENIREAYNVNFKSGDKIYNGRGEIRFRDCRFITRGIPFQLSSLGATYGKLQLFNCQVDTSNGYVVTAGNVNNELIVNGLTRNCATLNTGTAMNVTNVANDIYWDNFKITNPWYTYPFDT